MRTGKSKQKEKCFDLLIGNHSTTSLSQWFTNDIAILRAPKLGCFFLPKRSYNIDWKVNVYYLRYEVFFQGQCNMQTANSTTLIIDKLYLLFLLEFPPIQHGLNLHEQRFLNCRLQRNRRHSLFFTLCNCLFCLSDDYISKE